MIPKDVKPKPVCVLVLIMCLTSDYVRSAKNTEERLLFCVIIIAQNLVTLKKQHSNIAVGSTNCLKMFLVMKKGVLLKYVDSVKLIHVYSISLFPTINFVQKLTAKCKLLTTSLP